MCVTVTYVCSHHSLCELTRVIMVSRLSNINFCFKVEIRLRKLFGLVSVSGSGYVCVAFEYVLLCGCGGWVLK